MGALPRRTLLYGLAGTSANYNPSGDYHDITSGNNGYAAGPGYDLVTGIGTPVANLLVPALAHPPGPDLTVTSTHVGNFRPGDVGDTYTITATNSGTAPTSGTVSVADTLPAGLTARRVLAGASWSVNLATLTATRSDPLAAGASYPALTLTVNVAAAPADVTNTATVSGGGETNTSNDTASDPTFIGLPEVTGTSPSLQGGTLPLGTSSLAVNFNVTVLGAGTAADYQLQSVGPDGLLGTADNDSVALSASTAAPPRHSASRRWRKTSIA